MDDFSTAKPGDKLYSLKYGEVTVTEAYCTSVRCNISEIDGWVTYDTDGHCATMKTRDLYWSKPEIIAPPKPPRMVEKKYEFWVNVYPDGIGCTYFSKNAADINANHARLGEAEHIVRTAIEEE